MTFRECLDKLLGRLFLKILYFQLDRFVRRYRQVFEELR